jgi:hypothetical protein
VKRRTKKLSLLIYLYTALLKAARAEEKCENVRDFEGVERKKEARFKHTLKTT